MSDSDPASEPDPSPTASAAEAADDASPPDDAASNGEAAESLSPFLAAVRAPISEDAPAGDDVLYDEDFRTLKTQIDAIGSAGGTADYEQIADLAHGILAEKSKDLRAAGYLVLAEARLRGADGLARATRAVRLLIDVYWDDLYPDASRMQGRGNALQFVADRIPDWLSEASFEAADRASLSAALDDLNAIQEFGLQEMGEHAPALSGLTRDLEDVVDDLPEPDPDPDETTAPDAGSGSDETTDADEDGSTGEPEGDGTAPTAVTTEADALEATRTAIQFYRDEDLADPVPYRLARAIRWGPLRSVPPNEGGTTRFEAPRAQRRDYLEGLLAKDQYETLVREGEASMQGATVHVWLDLQRLVAAALDALGVPYEDAHRAVRTELALLLRRLPDLPTLSFSDGTPFADSLTRDWIETEVEPLLAGDGQDDASSPSESDDEDAMASRYEDARSALGGGDFEEALAIMTDGYAPDATGKDAFRRRLYVATLCLTADRPALARPVLDRLEASVERHALETWDPSLAVEVWIRRCRCYEQLAEAAPPDEEDPLRAEADAAFDKVCRIDPTVAASLAPRQTT